jgi:hypothetical protein
VMSRSKSGSPTCSVVWRRLSERRTQRNEVYES